MKTITATLLLALALPLAANAGVIRATGKAAYKTADVAVHMSAASAAKDAVKGSEFVAKKAAHGFVYFVKHLW